MHRLMILDRLHSWMAKGRRPNRRLAPAVGSLEDRQLLSGVPVPTATMTQTTTYQNLESDPNAATQALLYFSASMGTLTEVDVVTSGAFTTQFQARNLGVTTSTITGTTNANLTIKLGSETFPVTIPAVAESFTAAALGGKSFAPATSSSAAQTSVLTSSSDLAAFTNEFRIPVVISGHAVGNATSTNNDMSDGFSTQTSATITIIYHYTPGTSTSAPPTSGSPPSSSTGSTSTGTTPPATTGTTTSNPGQPLSTQTTQSSTHGKKAKHAVVAKATHKTVHHPAVVHAKPKPQVHARGSKVHSK